MSIKYMAAIWEYEELKGGDLLVMLALADHANDSGICWPSIPRLAHRARLTERQTQRIIKKLEQQGFIEIPRRGAGRGHSTIYQIRLKDDTHVTVSNQKGDAHDTVSDGKKGDICDKKGDICDIKGDMGVTRTIIEPSLEPSSSAAPNDDDDDEWRQVTEAMHKAGITLSGYMSEQYQDMLNEFGVDAVLVGIKSAADNGKAGRLRYVRTCVENAVNGDTNGYGPSTNVEVKRIEGDDYL